MLTFIIYTTLLAIAWLLPTMLSRRGQPRLAQGRSSITDQIRHVPTRREASSVQYPRTPEDVSRAVRYIQKASTSNIPPELLKPILYYADYDCIHFRAHSDTTVTRRSNNPEICYIRTEPLKYISPMNTDSSGFERNGRLRALRVEVTGRDQGWGGDASGSWSWFEVVRRPAAIGATGRRNQAQPQSSLRLAHNAVASKEWQHHEMDSESNEEMRAWARGLQNGDRVGIMLMARYPGWSCSASSGSIDVEVEVWR